MSYLIRDLAESERPYEKALSYGVETLSDAELLSVIIRTGTKKMGALAIANRILELHPLEKGLLGLNYLSRSDLKKIPGIGDTKATELLCAIELSKRIRERSFLERISFRDVQTVGEYCLQKCRFLQTEHVFVMLLSPASHLITEISLTEGTVDVSIASPREIFIAALKYEAAGIIVYHNHPSGNPLPSDADLRFTKMLEQAGAMLGIRLIDHVIIGNNSYISLREKGHILET